MKIEEKIEKLKEYLKNKKSILAFSAGSDSTLIAYILSQVSPNSVLVTIDNNMMPKDFINYTKEKAKELNLKHDVINVNFLKNPEFISNNQKRCYNCRKIMYLKIQELSYFNEYDYFLEGTNLTDLLEDRPGILVRKTYNMTSPLIECGITKNDVFNMIKYLNLTYSHNTTCLATRVKTNEEVSMEKFKLIDEAETYLKKYIKQENIRVRFDSYTATISIDEPLEVLDKNLIKNIRDKLQELGFKKVLLDITGYMKTKLTYNIDNNIYFYKLPYNIDLKRTYENIIENTKLGEESKLNSKTINYDDITIEDNGKISMPETNDFIDKFNKILPSIERKI